MSAEPDASQAPPDLCSSLGSLAEFQRLVESRTLAQGQDNRGDARQIAPSLYYFVLTYKTHFCSLANDQQRGFITTLADFVRRKRQETAKTVVLGPGRAVIALLEPERGLQRRQIDTLVKQYGAHAQVFKAEGATTVAEVAAEFLTSLQHAAESDHPATVVVLGHGTPDNIRAYSIHYEAVAQALLSGAATRDQRAVDLSRLVFIFDDCYSADYSIKLAAALDRQAKSTGLTMESLPVMISSVNRNRVGYHRSGELFVPRFWEALIQLYYVNKPLPAQVTLGDFFGRIDHYMYGFGRVPIFEGTRIIDHKLVDPAQTQDPVFFVPLKKTEVDELRSRLGLPPEATISPLMDIGFADRPPRRQSIARVVPSSPTPRPAKDSVSSLS
ncbi:MAG TPA: hypothetical protein VHV77_11935 [Pirellulales bacterium]|nr:hypothetical protein [Pirellulales bacterium]